MANITTAPVAPWCVYNIQVGSWGVAAHVFKERTCAGVSAKKPLGNTRQQVADLQTYAEP